MAPRIAVDVGCTTVVAAAQDDAGGPARLLAFEGEDGPAGTLAASLTWSAGGLTRVGIDADRALDANPHGGVRGPLAHLESGSATLELEPGPVPVVALVAELLARPLRAAARELAAPPEQALLTMPSAWAADGRRARALRAAAALAGLPPVTLVASAVAAAALAAPTGSDAPEVLLVCDVGGRTGQLALVDLGDGGERLLATTELAIGADLFDELLYHEVVRELGEEHPEAARRLEELHLFAGETEAGWAACQAQLARAVRHCREALTSAATYALAIGDPVGVTVQVEAERVRNLLQTESQILAGAAREQLAQADVGAARPGALLVGGGALTPGLRDALQAELDLPVVCPPEPVTVVARGALAAAAAPGAAPARAVPRGPARAPRRPAPSGPVPRTVLEDVVAAATDGDDVVAVVRHDAHHRAVRIDARGRVGAAYSVPGSEISGLAATAAAVVAWGPAAATVLSADLRPVTTIERPLLAAAAGDSVWVLAAGGEQAPVLTLATLAVAGREGTVVDAGRVGLAAPVQAGRTTRRAGKPAPPGPSAVVAGGRLHFAVPARGRGGTATQRIGAAGPAGLGEVSTRSGPDWVTAQAPAADGRLLTVTGGGAAALWLGDAQLAAWPPGVRVRLDARDREAPWIVAARRARWEVLRLDGDEVAAVRPGDGAVEVALAIEDGLWLVCESGGARRLVRVGPGGELERVAALNAPLQPIGRAGEEVLALVGPRGAPRTLVALTPD